MKRIILFFQGEKRSCITKINNLIWRVVCGINSTSLLHLKGGVHYLGKRSGCVMTYDAKMK